MPRFQVLLVLSFIVLAGLQVQPLVGDGPPSQTADGKGQAHTQPPQDDVNFVLMGEFIGTIKTAEKKSQILGLQVRPIANHQFEATAYFGGLPGQKKHQPEPMRLIGKRFDDFVMLSGGPWAIFVDKNSCLLMDRSGKQIGRLKRIKRRSPTLHAPPPKIATVLFDGTNVEQFTGARMTDGGLLMEGADVKPMFQDFNLHVEFRLPYMPQADGQNRANSGLYLQSRYESQVLDSFGTLPLINGLGAIYQFRPPELNMCFPPLVWQTYDIQFTAPRWAADGSKIRDARLTSWVNGVKVQDNIALPKQTGRGQIEEPVLKPIRLQDHGDPVRYRNVWIVDRGLESIEFPVVSTKDDIKAALTAERNRKRERAKAAKKRAEAARKKAAQEKAVEEKAAQEKAGAEKAGAEKAVEKKAVEKKVNKKKAADEKAPPTKSKPGQQLDGQEKSAQEQVGQ